MPNQPMAEVFGFPINNQSPNARRHRQNRLCPFNNKIANCTKDKANDPLGVCSVFEGNNVTVTCPIRFRENWIITDHAADFFFGPGATWTSLTEVRLKDANGKSAGNIDVVLVQYNDRGKITDFGSIEVQAVYISGNVRRPFARYMQDPAANGNLDWRGEKNYPTADFLSSSRKRLAPQLIFKGGILHAWRKKQVVVIDRPFFNTLPTLQQVPANEAEMAWMIYQLDLDAVSNEYRLRRDEVVYTKFVTAMDTITKTEAGPVEEFISQLQAKLDKHLEPPDNLLITELPLTE